MAIFDEEVFGPVICATSFNSRSPIEEVAAAANDNPYGLAAKIWTNDLSQIARLTRLLQAGSIIVNGGGGEKALPFGGFKQSGMGRENGREGILEFTEIKTVRIGL